MAYKFHFPDIGEGLYEAEILTWFVKVGDHVSENESIAEVQTDKAVVEIPSPTTGTVLSLGAKEGEIVKVGDVLITIKEDPGVRAKSSARRQAQQGLSINEILLKGNEDVINNKASPQIKNKANEQNLTDERQHKKNKRVIAAPYVRRYARELGIDITKVPPTGSGGKVTEDDVKRYSEQAEQEIASTTITQKDDELVTTMEVGQLPNSDSTPKKEPIRGLRKLIYENMKLSKSTAVHCTGMDEIVVTKLVQLRKRLAPYAEEKGVKLTYLPFFIKAVAAALEKYPVFNSTVNDETMEIIYHQEINVGMATAMEDGLLVPVIRNANLKSIMDIAKEINELTVRARERKLTRQELTGSTFTISNTGRNGGFYATPIINYPEVAIMGIHSIRKKPIVVNDEIVVGDVMGVSITFDHRIIDGAHANIFMNEVHTFIQNIDRQILEGR